MSADKKFREDINGLRAIAVLLVIIFHYSSNWLSGGFIGVDVFFVISGYLMTSIIFTGLENNRFSLIKFLLSRVKRIAPGLLTVVIGTLAIGYLFLEPLLYKPLGEHSFGSMLFYSNVLYAKEFGYFDLGAETKFLLHTWSLSVEWQFYVLYPVLLILFKKIISIEKLKLIVLACTIASFGFMLYAINYDSNGLYYRLFPRAWEMLVGGIAFLYPLKLKIPKFFLEAIGTATIIFCAFFVNSSQTWPSPFTLLPILATYIILVQKEDGHLLNGWVLQKLGLISYSLYLVHWPLLTLTKQYFDSFNFAIYIALSLALSIILYKLVESRREFGLKFMLAFSTALLASYLVSIDGAAYRISDKFRLTSSDYHLKYYGGGNYRSLGDVAYINMEPQDSPDIIVVGDSYMRQYVIYFENHKIKVVNIFKDDCFSTENYFTSKWYDLCAPRYENLIKTMDKYPNAPIIMGQAWRTTRLQIFQRNSGDELSTPDPLNLLLSEFEKLFNKYSDRTFYVLGLTPGLGNGQLSYSCLAKESLPVFEKLGNTICPSFINKNESPLNQTIEERVSKFKNAHFVNASSVLCDNKMCRTLDEDRNPIYSDRGHLSIYGAEYVGSRIMSDILKK